VNGFAGQDWRELAKPGAAAAIYMGAAAATFLRGRLLMHGARADTPVTAVESASRPDQRTIATTLMQLPEALAEAAPHGPVLILYGLAPRAAAAAELREAL
jgi:uroporphyrin-III C-methyltransferase/precorrin-2 dehydrogenase/sirohydrochlorin ferrochelatase